MLALKIDLYSIEAKAAGSNGYIPHLKGIMIGNGVTTWKYDGLPATFEMGYYFGLIDSGLYHNFKKNCNFSGSSSDECSTWI